MSDNMKPVLNKVAAGQSLSADEAEAAFGVIMSGEATPAQIAGLLMALRVRGETVDEMSGLVGALFQSTSRSPIGGILVIALGVLMLLFTLEVFSIRDVAPYWPVLLIIFGVWRLYAAVRLRAQEGEAEEARRYERETY